MEKWANTLQTALSYNLQHYSIYNLIYEEGTRLTKDLNSSKINALPEDMEEEIYNYTVQEMQNKNYKQYEISNYNKENYFSRHNIKYWTHQEYYGFGPSSHSFDGKKRYWNFSNLNKYSENIYKNQLPIEDIDELDNDKIIRETIMLGLRFGGVPILPLKDIYQVDLLDLISNNENLFKRHLEPNINKLIISPSSKFIANEIVINLIKYIELKIIK
jgi:oxygen-independent coproporphyrinogen-3 oxidase